MGDIGVKHRSYADHAATTPLMPEAQQEGVIRISLGSENTVEDVKRITSALI